jgi:hypothetical protein
VGTITYPLRSSTPLNQTEFNVSQAVAYQSPLWIDLSCKTLLREYSCSLLYQPYGVWMSDTDDTNTNTNTSTPEQRVYCAELCDRVMAGCEAFFDLAESIGLHYQADWYGDDDDVQEGAISPRKFVKDHCLSGTVGGTVGAPCYTAEIRILAWTNAKTH